MSILTKRSARLGDNDVRRLAQNYARHLMDGADKISKHNDRVYAAYDPNEGISVLMARRGSKTRALPKLTDIGHMEGGAALLDVLSGMGVAYDPDIEMFFDGSLS